MSISIEKTGENDVLKGCLVATNEDKGIKYTFYIKDGKVIAECRKSKEFDSDVECWYNADGKEHRDCDLPAVIWYKNGVKTSERWYRDGKKHRDGDLPAMIYYENGVKTLEYWYRDDKKHRDGDLPAAIYYENGVKTIEWWYRDGKQYTPEKPKTTEDHLAEIEAHIAKIAECLAKIRKETAKK